MLTIFKYEIPVADEFAILMPIGAKLVCVQVQHDMPQVWALVDTDALLENKQFAMRGTGHNCDNIKHATYVGTFQLREGQLVFHLFEL